MRLFFKNTLLFANSAIRLDGSRFRNFARALTQEQLSVPNQDTLTGRILIYLNTENEQRPDPSKTTSDILQNFRHNRNSLHRLNSSEIVNFSSILTEQTIARNEVLLILRELDRECYSRLSELSPTQILRLLNVYMKLIPSRITEFKFYKHSLKILHNSLSTLDKRDVLQFIFYVGLTKKNTEAQTMLRRCMRRMDDHFITSLTTEELCIICNSTFKTSTKITNKSLLDITRKHINDNLRVINDSALFITLVKTLRHNRYQNDDLLNTISCSAFFNKSYALYSFPGLCHILALFADYFYYDKQFFKMFTRKCLEQLGESSFASKRLYLTEQLRGKDIKRFLWIISMFSDLKLVSQSDIKSVIIPKIIERIRGGEFTRDFEFVIDITLYLWMLNYRCEELVPYLFSGESSRLMSATPKNNLRLNILLYAIYLEDPELSKKIPINPITIPVSAYCPTYQLQKRPLLERLLRQLNGIKKEFGINRFELGRSVLHLNIIGITGYRNDNDKVVYVEVLDDYTRIKNLECDTPVGLMSLKLRLLNRLEEGVLVVSQKETEEMSDAELNDYLLDELKLIC